VKTILDGDSFETSDGIKVRLIGVDAPDIETSDCFSAEATTHLESLMGPPRSVRLAYDTSRTDRFGRTLAYVYRLPDGLLVNLAMAQDGFAREQKVEPNVTHADELAAAVTDARTAKRGLWSTCETTTTTAKATTTTARATTTVAPATTTTAEPTTTTTVPTSTTSTTAAPPVVLVDTPCSPLGATAVFADGKPAVCVGTITGTRRPGT
jgi:micrococcal nuclease